MKEGIRIFLFGNFDIDLIFIFKKKKKKIIVNKCLILFIKYIIEYLNGLLWILYIKYIIMIDIWVKVYFY